MPRIFFSKHYEKELSPLTYDSSLLRFCISVLWRVLLVGIEEAESHNARCKPPLDFIAFARASWKYGVNFFDENAQDGREMFYFEVRY